MAGEAAGEGGVIMVDVGAEKNHKCSRCGLHIGGPDSGLIGCVCVPKDHYQAKRDQGKLRPSLIPWRGLRLVIEVAEFGISNGYKPHSWKDVPDARARYREALLRHALEYASDAGSRCEESKLTHLAHVGWNALALLALMGPSDA